MSIIKLNIFIFLFFILSVFKLNSEIIKLTTPDGCNIEVFQKIYSTKNFIVFEVHGLGSNKDEWNKFNSYLDREKINYISVDLRGHGKSTNCNNRELKYPRITEKDIKGFLKDLETVYKKLKQSFSTRQIIPAGASIGANLVLTYFYNKSKKIILLSPGLNYGGYEIIEHIKKSNSKILFSTSEIDIYSFNSTRILIEIYQKRNKKWDLILASKGHGVQIFDEKEGEKYIEKIIEFIKSTP